MMDLNAYTRQLATENVDFAHTEEKKAYYREFSSSRILLDTDFHDNLRYSANNVLISQFNDDSQLPEPASDVNMQSQTGAIYILTRITDNDMEAARVKSNLLRDDIISRIKHDYRSGIFPKDFIIKKYNTHTIGRVASNFFGIIVLMAYWQSYRPQYNAEKWTSVS